MNYRDILGSCDETTVGQLVSRCPQTLDVFRKYVPDIDDRSQTTVEIIAATADRDREPLCQELSDTVMEQTPIEALDTDMLLELILRGYDAGHLEQLPKLHRLARKIEAVHRANPDVPEISVLRGV